MKRNIKILLTMLLLAFTLVGCGEKKYETVKIMLATHTDMTTDFAWKVAEKIFEKYEEVVSLIYIEKAFYTENIKELGDVQKYIEKKGKEKGTVYGNIIDERVVNGIIDLERWYNYFHAHDEERLNNKDNIEVKNILDL